MKLPGGERAVVKRQKVVGYTLLTTHEVGGPKARVFKSALGLTTDDADVLIDALKQAAASEEAIPIFADEYGTRYRIDFMLEFGSRRRVIRSGWLIRTVGAPPEFMSAWVLNANAARS